jgi:adenine-specific DNA-methyltransferase
LKLEFEGKRDIKDLLSLIPDIGPLQVIPVTSNQLLLGDNLELMKSLILHHEMKGMVQLVYIDPPYSSNNVFRVSEQRMNTISRSQKGKIAYTDKLMNDEYLEFIQDRLLLIKELLSENGSVYVHIDNTMGHYVKILMDEIFGKSNFLNDISRKKCNPKNFLSKSFGNIKDNILFYSKSGKHIWNDPKKTKTNAELERGYKKISPNGRRYTTIPLHAPGETKNGLTGQRWRGVLPPEGRHWRSAPAELEKLAEQGLVEWSSKGNPRKMIFADEDKGSRVQDIIEFKDPQKPSYPTEKNSDLLELLIGASSNDGDIVFDCFCGSGSTLVAAKKLGRRYIGMDSSEIAISVSERRLKNLL